MKETTLGVFRELHGDGLLIERPVWWNEVGKSTSCGFYGAGWIIWTTVSVGFPPPRSFAI